MIVTVQFDTDKEDDELMTIVAAPRMSEALRIIHLGMTDAINGRGEIKTIEDACKMVCDTIGAHELFDVLGI